MRIFIDHFKNPMDGFDVVIRSFDEAIKFNGLSKFISFGDFDSLVENRTSFDLAIWIINELIDDNLAVPYDFRYVYHGSNLELSQKIEKLLDQYI